MTIYNTRYQAKKAMGAADMAIVKVCGGYALMTWSDYWTWKRQK